MDLSYFDQTVERRNTDCCKWDEVDVTLGNKDCLHLGVADADFRSPECINNTVHQLANYGLYGYTGVFPSFYQAVQGWMLRQHQVHIESEHVIFTPRINVALGLLLQEFSDINDSVILHKPFYWPLMAAIKDHQRKLINPALVEDGDSYRMDLESLALQCDASTKVFVLVSPHNPTTRIWSINELIAIARFCLQHDLILFVDEIHSDFISQGYVFTSILRLLESDIVDKVSVDGKVWSQQESLLLAEKLIVASSPAKTFNIPGAVTAYLITKSPKLKQGFLNQLNKLGETNPNIFGNALLKTAYTQADDYVKLVNQYIDLNAQYFVPKFQELFPKAKIKRREGTYLIWVDMHECFANEEALIDFCNNQAHVVFQYGEHFGLTNHLRVNLATQRKVLEEVIARFQKALTK